MLNDNNFIVYGEYSLGIDWNVCIRGEKSHEFYNVGTTVNIDDEP